MKAKYQKKQIPTNFNVEKWSGTFSIQFHLPDQRRIMSEELKEYTSEEVAKHNKQDDCWLIIGNDKTGKFKPLDRYFHRAPFKRRVEHFFWGLKYAYTL